jgi:hypothetical protein
MEPSETLWELGFTQSEFLAIAWLSRLRAQVTRTGLSLFITVDGRHRSGKSRCWVAIACLFSDSFAKDKKKFIVRDADDMLNLVEECDQKKIINPVIIVDEAGSALNSADWYENIQKAIIKTMTIIGYLHPTIVFLAPIKNLILSGIRQMSHVHVKMTRSSNSYSCAVPYEVHFNSLKSKAYFKKFRITLFGQPKVVDNIRVSLPPKAIDDEYALIEQERKPLMLRDIKEDALTAQIKKARDVVDYDNITKIVHDNWKKYAGSKLNETRKRVNELLIRAPFRLSVNDAKVVAMRVNRMLEENNDPKIETEVEEAIEEPAQEKQKKKPKGEVPVEDLR